MPLYLWHCQSLAQHSRGYAIAYAETPDKAREVIRSTSRMYFSKTRWDAKFDLRSTEDTTDWRNFRDLLERDLLKEPEIRPAMFIAGSE